MYKFNKLEKLKMGKNMNYENSLNGRNNFFYLIKKIIYI